jgi:hypothetical protein
VATSVGGIRPGDTRQQMAEILREKEKLVGVREFRGIFIP